MWRDGRANNRELGDIKSRSGTMLASVDTSACDWFNALLLLGRESHSHTALPEISLHQLAARAVTLCQSGRIKNGLLQTLPIQRFLEGRYMRVEVSIV